jgi:hypothetical protein
MTRFPVDAPNGRVIKTMEILGFRLIRKRKHISMLRENPDGGKTPLTMPNHPFIKASALKPSAPRLESPERIFWLPIIKAI